MANDKDRMTVDQALENVRVLGREVERLRAILACIPWKAYCNDVVKPDPSSPSLADAVMLPLTRGELTFLRVCVVEHNDCVDGPREHPELWRKLIEAGAALEGR